MAKINIHEIITTLDGLRKNVNNDLNSEHISYNSALTDAKKAINTLVLKRKDKYAPSRKINER